MDIPFDLSFHHYYKETQTDSKKLECFVLNQDALSELDEGKLVTLTENIDLAVSFSAPEGSKLYMDGLDTLPEEMVSIDRYGIAYLNPSEREYKLYSYNQQQLYPFIPGFYRIVVEVDDRKYYSWIRIKPKQITQEQWEAMRDEIEETVNGLAQDIIRQNSNVAGYGNAPIPFTYMRQWLVLNNHKGALINALEGINKQPRFSIIKTYQIVPKPRAKRADEKSIKYISQHPEKPDLFNEPLPKISYTLPENQWIKVIVKDLMKITSNLLDFLDSYEVSIESELQALTRWRKPGDAELRTKQKALGNIQDMRRECRQIRTGLARFLNQSWLAEVPTKLTHPVPLALTLDSRYHNVYSVYREIQAEDFSITLDPAYTFHWKRTDRLYEIWGYLQVIKALSSEEAGFTPVKGWMYDQSIGNQQIAIPNLTPGAYVELTRGSITVRAVYDAELPAHPDDTDPMNPVYTTADNYRPDCRLDVFDDGMYIGSAIIDFKYRPTKYIWNKEAVRTRSQTSTMKQLGNYRNSCSSPWYMKGVIPTRMVKGFRPIYEVWAVFPDKYNSHHNREVDEYSVRMVDLTPKEDNTHVRGYLMQVVESIVENAAEWVS